MILAFAHPGIVVNDLEKGREFYQRMFGFKVISREGWNASPAADTATGLIDSSCKGYMLAGHNCFLELFQFDSTNETNTSGKRPLADEPGIRHLAFYVDDVKMETQRFLALGGTELGMPEGNAVYLYDPFGNIIELCEIPSTDEDPVRLPGVAALDNFSGVPE